jgi:hypothetical protein
VAHDFICDGVYRDPDTYGFFLPPKGVVEKSVVCPYGWVRVSGEVAYLLDEGSRFV